MDSVWFGACKLYSNKVTMFGSTPECIPTCSWWSALLGSTPESAYQQGWSCCSGARLSAYQQPAVAAGRGSDSACTVFPHV